MSCAGTRRTRVRGRHAAFIDKPLAIHNYNENMGGVDRVSQMIEPYDATRRSLAWYKKIAIHLLQMALLNAWVVYGKQGGQLNFLKFTLSVVSSLISEDVPPNVMDENVMRLTGRHFIHILPPTQAKANTQRRCKVCSAKGLGRRDTRYYCPQCPSNPGLCFENCFEEYHTKADYS